MKNFLKLFRIIAFATTIIFSLAACASPNDSGDPPPIIDHPVIIDPIPVSADYNISNRTQAKGSVTAVNITPKAGKSSGARTIYYEGIGGTNYQKSTALPVEEGAYAVTFNVAAVSGWQAANGLSAGSLIIYKLEAGTGVIGDPLTINLSFSNDEEFVNFKLDDSEKYIKLVISGNITTVPDNVFNTYDASITEDCKYIGNDKLVSVIFPNSVTTIKSNAFSKCENLTSITMNGVTEIEPYTFEHTGFTSITIPDSVLIIGQGAFVDCENLESVTIGKNVQSIGNWAFLGEKFTTINVAVGNTAYSAENGVLYNYDKTQIKIYPQGKTGAFTIPNIRKIARFT